MACRGSAVRIRLAPLKTKTTFPLRQVVFLLDTLARNRRRSGRIEAVGADAHPTHLQDQEALWKDAANQWHASRHAGSVMGHERFTELIGDSGFDCAIAKWLGETKNRIASLVNVD